MSCTILFVGPLRSGSTTLHRMLALQDIGYNVRSLDSWHAIAPLHPLSIFDRLTAKAYRSGLTAAPMGRDWSDINRRITNAFGLSTWDILWIDKGLTISPDTLIKTKEIAPHLRIVGYSPDDMIARHNHSRHFLDCLPLYDAFFTTKSYNVIELKKLGCREVFFIDNAYDSRSHNPMQLKKQEREQLGAPIGFIGSFEKQRADSMKVLARAGFPVRIYGANWSRRPFRQDKSLRIEGKTMIGEAYAKAICSFDINLHFLRKANRDQQTTRSVEIPACGKLMIAERTEEHQALFEDQKEAVFFDSNDELIDKVKFYLKNPSEAGKIGLAARRRCIQSGYSNQHRMRYILSIINEF